MRRRFVPMIALGALTLAACGGAGGGGGNSEVQDNPTSLTVTAGDEPVAQPLAPGRYRLTITEDCDDYGITITQESGPPVDGQPFSYELSNSPIRIVFVNDVPGGDFLIEQTNPDCTDWTFDLTRVSGG